MGKNWLWFFLNIHLAKVQGLLALWGGGECGKTASLPLLYVKLVLPFWPFGCTYEILKCTPARVSYSTSKNVSYK